MQNLEKGKTAYMRNIDFSSLSTLNSLHQLKSGDWQIPTSLYCTPCIIWYCLQYNLKLSKCSYFATCKIWNCLHCEPQISTCLYFA